MDFWGVLFVRFRVWACYKFNLGFKVLSFVGPHVKVWFQDLGLVFLEVEF